MNILSSIHSVVTVCGNITAPNIAPSANINGNIGQSFNNMRVYGNTLYTTDYTNGIISIFDLSVNRLVRRTVNYNYPTERPIGMDIDLNGNLYVMHTCWDPYGTYANVVIYDSNTLVTKNTNFINIPGLQNGGWDVTVNGSYLYVGVNVNLYRGQIMSYNKNTGTQFGPTILYDQNGKDVINVRVYNGNLYCDCVEQSTVFSYPIHGNGSIIDSQTTVLTDSISVYRTYCMRGNVIYTYRPGQSTISKWVLGGSGNTVINTTNGLPLDSLEPSSDGTSLYVAQGNLIIPQKI
jgi:hypothetical protein